MKRKQTKGNPAHDSLIQGVSKLITENALTRKSLNESNVETLNTLLDLGEAIDRAKKDIQDFLAIRKLQSGK